MLPLLCLGSLEEPNREREFSSPFTAGRVVEAFSPKQKNILYCHFYSRLGLETEQSYGSVLLLTRRTERSRSLYRSSRRLQTGGSNRRLRVLGAGRARPGRPGGPDPAVPAAGHRGAPKPHGWGGGAGAGPRGPAAAPPRGAAGRGRRGGPQRPSPGGASVTLLRGGLAAGPAPGSAGSY